MGQTKKAGPIIQDYGKVWAIANPDYKVEKNTTFKVVFDIYNSPEDPAKLNTSIATAARFLNMHGQNGVALSHMQIALVLHGKATTDVLSNAVYKNRYGFANPNADMIDKLLAAGVDFILCGQSAMSRNVPKEAMIKGVQRSLSAMTALVQLQNKGYRLIKF